ncbi:MAG: YebC/PmpR family DNA-binding transcriptional regulator, partial [Actinomycetota bacterium]
CEAGSVYDLKAALETSGLTVVSAESTMVSSTVIEVADAEVAKKILRIMEALDDNDDVQDVFANFDINDDIMEEVG